jgi:hypothetical protein
MAHLQKIDKLHPRRTAFAAMKERTKRFVASKKIAKRAMLAKFLKCGIKPDSNLTAPGMTFGSLSANKSTEFFRCPLKLQKASNQLSFSSC